MEPGGFKAYVFFLPVIVVASFGCARPESGPQRTRDQNPSPMVDHIRSHDRILEEEWRGMEFEINLLPEQPVKVFIPDRETDSGFQVIWIHFHGAGFIMQSAISTAIEPVIGVHIHLGSGSSVYETAFLKSSTFENLVETVIERCRVHGLWLHPGHHIYLSSFSAGYGAIRSILSNYSSDIRGVLLLDGLHADYIPAGVPVFEGGRIGEDKLISFSSFARLASEGKKHMVITHSEIFPGTYASTTETTDYIIQELGLERQAVLEWGPGGMQMIAVTRSCGLAILGFAGNSAPDHIDHLHGLPYFMNRILEQQSYAR